MSKSNFDASVDIQNQDLYPLSLILISAMTKMLEAKGQIYLSSEPKISEKPIVQFQRRMRIDGLEKFNARTAMASINFYKDNEDMEHGKALGAIIVYIPTEYLSRLMWMLDYDRIDEDEEDVAMAACGTVANLIGGHFVKELSAHGYIFLQMSHFEGFINSCLNGINFFFEEDYKHEIEFYIKGEKQIVVELSMKKLQRY